MARPRWCSAGEGPVGARATKVKVGDDVDPLLGRPRGCRGNRGCVVVADSRRLSHRGRRQEETNQRRAQAPPHRHSHHLPLERRKPALRPCRRECGARQGGWKDVADDALWLVVGGGLSAVLEDQSTPAKRLDSSLRPSSTGQAYASGHDAQPLGTVSLRLKAGDRVRLEADEPGARSDSR